MLQLDKQRILFVGGKGGVGKTTTAAALALSFAERGERCLLVSTDPAHSLGDLFDARIGDRETELVPNLLAVEIDPEAQVAGHLESVKRTMRELVRPEMYPEIDRQMELTRLSPGAVEAAMLERVSEIMISGDKRFDRIVFDTAPTGHTLRLLSLPEIMAAWTDGLLKHRERSDAWGVTLKRIDSSRGEDISFIETEGEAPEDARSSRVRETLLERRRKFYQARRLLLDPKTTAFLLVLIPEKLPILESQKALQVLSAHGVPVAGLVINRVLPDEPLGEFLEQRREQERTYLRQIDHIFRNVGRLEIPLLPRDVVGLAGLRLVAAHLLGAAEDSR